MNILIVTQEDPFYIPLFFERFLKNYSHDSEINIKGIVIQDSLGNSRIDLAKRMFHFFGAFNFFRQGFLFAIKKLQEKAYSAGLLSKASTISYYAESAGIPVLHFKSMNSEEALSYVSEHNIDLIVSVSASEIFREQILSAPTYGCINLHNAPLPDYRGMLPNFWQMYHNEPNSVLTFHTMTDKLDKGQIVSQLETEIKPEYSFDDLAKISKIRSADALWEVLTMYQNGTVDFEEMPDKKGSYFTFPNKKDVAEFKKRGKKLL